MTSPATPRSGLNTQICGDAHLSNFGVFASPERQLMFDINDFDETLPGPWEWDVKRLAASFEIAGRDRGFTPSGAARGRHGRRRRVPDPDASDGRRTQPRRLVRPHRGRAGSSKQLKTSATKKQQAKAQANVAKARTRDSMQAFTKLTHEVDGHRRIVADPPLIVPIEDLFPTGTGRDDVEGEFRGLLRSYRRTLETDRRELLESFEYVHAARKVVGVGSVGTRAWIILLLGRDGQDPLFLQAKEAQESVLERFVGKSKYANHGQRVVAGQRLMQAASDIFLGWQRVAGLRRAGARLLHPSAARLEGLGRRRHHGLERDGAPTPGSAARPWPVPMPAPATGSRSRPTWATATSSTVPSPTSRRPTPTRTSATTRPRRRRRLRPPRGTDRLVVSNGWPSDWPHPGAEAPAEGPIGAGLRCTDRPRDARLVVGPAWIHDADHRA